MTTATKINDSIAAEVSPDGNKIILTIDLDRPGTESKSGKSMVHASTQGNVKIPGTDLIMGLNIYSSAK